MRTVELFIVPNGLCTKKDMRPSFDDQLKFIGETCPESELLVQVWVTDVDPYVSSGKCKHGLSDNWADHGFTSANSVEEQRKIAREAEMDVDENIHRVPGGFFPSRVPVSLLIGTKEGGNFPLVVNGEELNVVCKQLSHRYVLLGNFEDTLTRLIYSFAKRHKD